MATSYTFGGTALTTYGKVTLINDDFDFTETRGENIIIPFQHGETFVRKYFGSRKIIFGIVMTAATAGAMETLVDNLKAKLAPRTQQTLAQTREDSTVRNISATVDASIEPDRFTDKVTRAVLTFSCTSPFWRLSTAIADNTTTIDASPHAMGVTNPRTVEERNPTITLTGPLTNPVITNSTNGVVLTYPSAMSGGETVTIYQKADGEYTAIHSVSGEVIGNVTHSGSTALMVIDVGTNNLSIASDVITTGTVKVSF